MDSLAETGIAEFGRFRIDIRERSLHRVEESGNQSPVALGARAFDILALLVSRPGELVAKSDIMEAVWPAVVVEEGNLTVQISALRRVLDEGRG